MLVAGEVNLANLNRGAFLDIEVDLHRGGRNGLDLGADGRELVAVLGENLAQHSLGPLDLGRVILAFLGEADLLFFEAVKNVGLRHDIQALVIDFANGGFFLDVNIQDDSFFGVLALDAQVLEVTGVPQRIEIAFDRDRIVRIANVGEQAGKDSLLGNAPVADNTNLVHGLG